MKRRCPFSTMTGSNLARCACTGSIAIVMIAKTAPHVASRSGLFKFHRQVRIGPDRNALDTIRLHNGQRHWAPAESERRFVSSAPQDTCGITAVLAAVAVRIREHVNRAPEPSIEQLLGSDDFPLDLMLIQRGQRTVGDPMRLNRDALLLQVEKVFPVADGFF